MKSHFHFLEPNSLNKLSLVSSVEEIIQTIDGVYPLKFDPEIFFIEENIHLGENADYFFHAHNAIKISLQSYQTSHEYLVVSAGVPLFIKNRELTTGFENGIMGNLVAAITTEGLAILLVSEVLGVKVPKFYSEIPVGYSREKIFTMLLQESDVDSYDENKWFFGKADLPKFFGYVAGYILLQEMLNKGEDLKQLYTKDWSYFLDTMETYAKNT